MKQIFQNRFSWFCVVGLPIMKQKPLASCAVLTLEFAQLLKPSLPNWISSLKIMDLIAWSIRQLLPTEQQSCNAWLTELSEKSKTFTLTVFQPDFRGIVRSQTEVICNDQKLLFMMPFSVIQKCPKIKKWLKCLHENKPRSQLTSSLTEN